MSKVASSQSLLNAARCALEEDVQRAASLRANGQAAAADRLDARAEGIRTALEEAAAERHAAQEGR